MRVLLFLSVLLSALTGVGAGARAHDVAQAVAGQNVQAQVVAPAASVSVVRPSAALPRLRAVASTVARPIPMRADEPIWATRRRE